MRDGKKTPQQKQQETPRGNPPKPFAQFSERKKKKLSQMTDEWLDKSDWYTGKRNRGKAPQKRKRKQREAER